MFGVIGLGQMGGSIARKLLAEGRQTVVCDVRAEAVEATSAELVAGTPAELVALCSNSADSIVIVVVRDDAEVQNVVCGKKGILTGISESVPSGNEPVILIHSTVQPETVEEVAQVCANSGVAVLDAPVTGGAGAVENGD